MSSRGYRSFLLLLVLTVVAAFSQPRWKVPAEARDLKNPIPANQASLAAGKALYKTQCEYCHGKTGLGDGGKSTVLSTSPGNFSKPGFQAQTDGALFYKTKTGRGEMPAYGKRILMSKCDKW
ncbi:MAG: c-type cytochrome [Bacteroidales bacterium]